MTCAIDSLSGREHGDRVRDAKPSRRERSFKGLTSIYDRGYVVAGWRKIHVFAGREYIDWGPADWNNLITPGDQISIDQFGARIRLKNFRLSVFHGQLSPTAQRYFAGHRLEMRFGRTVIGINETVVYAGQDVDPIYLVPLGSFYGNQFNAKDNADNILWALDAKTTLFNRATIYGSFLIDDAQFERDGINPDKLAFDAGGRIAISNPFEMTLRAKFRMVDIFTYTHKDSLTSYVSGEGIPDQGDVLLGGDPGPDSDSWRIEAEVYPRPNVVTKGFVYSERRGTGNDLRRHIPPADPAPPFPLPPIQRTRGIGIEVKWEFNRNIWFSGAASRAWIYNAGYIRGADDTLDAFRVLIHWEFL